MAFELRPPDRLEDLTGLQGQIREACRELGLEGQAALDLLAGGSAAWAAALLAGGEGLALTLERLGTRLTLELRFDLPTSEGAPPGLDEALFCPPALRSDWLRSGRGASFSLVWDV